jgi:hypothetical protein
MLHLAAMPRRLNGLDRAFLDCLFDDLELDGVGDRLLGRLLCRGWVLARLPSLLIEARQIHAKAIAMWDGSGASGQVTPKSRGSTTVLHQPFVRPDEVKWSFAGQRAAAVLNCAA